MHPVFLTGVSFQDGTPHSYGMSVLRSAILHHHIYTVSAKVLTVFLLVVPA